jgi:hypothetical protein
MDQPLRTVHASRMTVAATWWYSTSPVECSFGFTSVENSVRYRGSRSKLAVARDRPTTTKAQTEMPAAALPHKACTHLVGMTIRTAGGDFLWRDLVPKRRQTIVVFLHSGLCFIYAFAVDSEIAFVVNERRPRLGENPTSIGHPKTCSVICYPLHPMVVFAVVGACGGEGPHLRPQQTVNFAIS